MRVIVRSCCWGLVALRGAAAGVADCTADSD